MIRRHFVLAVPALALLTVPRAGHAKDKVSFDLSYIVEHPAIEATKKGILATLAEAGYVPGGTMKLEDQCAQGSMPTQVQINRKFVGDNPDLIIAISTPSAQTALSATNTIPIVFAAVTDPLAAGLVDRLDRPGRNLTGSSDRTPIDKQLALIRAIMPAARRIGIIYNAGEANSVAQVNVIEKLAASDGLVIVAATATQTSAVLDAARSLVGRVDAIYVPTDSTVVSAIESVVRVGNETRIPVFAADTASVERGAVAALGFDYYDIGVAAGQSAVAILRGAKPGDLPVRFVDTVHLYLNKTSAQKMGVTLTESLINQATKVVE